MKNKALLVLAAAVLVICGAAFWFLQQTPVVAPSNPLTVITAEPTPVEPDPAGSRPPAGVPTPGVPKPPVASKEPPKPLASWEVKIEEVLASSVPESEMGRLLINLMPTTPPEGQVELAQHISNLVTDKDYSRVLPMVKNPNLPAEVLEVFVTDLMNRDDAVKLPALLEVAKLPNHPNHEEALTDLGIFLDQENGSDWGKWEVAMKAYLKKQAEENGPESTADGGPK